MDDNSIPTHVKTCQFTIFSEDKKHNDNQKLKFLSDGPIQWLLTMCSNSIGIVISWHRNFTSYRSKLKIRWFILFLFR